MFISKKKNIIDNEEKQEFNKKLEEDDQLDTLKKNTPEQKGSDALGSKQKIKDNTPKIMGINFDPVMKSKIKVFIMLAILFLVIIILIIIYASIRTNDQLLAGLIPVSIVVFGFLFVQAISIVKIWK